MEALQFSEEEIQDQLAVLGYKNIPRHRLHEVKQDLDVLIRSLTSPERRDSLATRAPPAVTKEKVSHVSSEGFFLHHRGDSAAQQVSGQTTDLQSTRGSDSYAQHSVAARQRLPAGAPSRLQVEPDSDDTLMSRDSFSSSRDAPVFRRKVLRKHQGGFLVCDESVCTDDSAHSPGDMYPNTRQEQESDEDSSNSSFWSDGEDQEDEVVEIQQVVWKDPLNGAVEHERKEATAREEPDLISKSEGSEEQRSRDHSGDGCETKDGGEGDQSEGDQSGDGCDTKDGGEGDQSEEDLSGDGCDTKDGGEGDQSEEDLSGDGCETKDGGEGDQSEGDQSGDGCDTKDGGEGDQSEEDLSGDGCETKVGGEGEEDLSGVEDGSEGSSKEDEGSEDDGNEGGSCGDDKEPASEDDEEEHCSEAHRGSSKSSSWSGEEHSVDMEERDSVEASAEDLVIQAPGRRADMNTESEDDPSWCDGGRQGRDQLVDDLHQSVRGSSAEHVDRSSEARKSLHSSERLHFRDDSREMLDRAAASLTDVPADRSDGFCGADKLGSEDKSPLDLSEDENQRANEASSQRFHSTSGDLRTSHDDDDGGREGESEEYDGSEDHSDEEANSLDSVFWFDQGRQHKEEEEPVEDAPGDEKFVVSFQHDTCEEEQRDQYEGSEEESEDGDSHCSSFWSGRANRNISDTGEKMDLREVDGLSESVKEVSGEDPDIRCPDTFWSDDQDEKFEGAVVDEGLEEEVNLSNEEDGGEERCSSSLDSPAPSLMTSGYGTLLPEDQEHQKVTEHEEDVALRNPVEAMCCGSTPPGGDDEDQRAQIQDPDQLSSGGDIKFLDVESSRSVEQGGDLRTPEQGAASSLDERLSQLQLSERLDSEVDDDDEAVAVAGDSDAEQHSLSAFESYVRALTRSCSDGDLRPKPKSFIRPVMVQARKKTDPVAKYFQYKQLWDLFKVPGEKDHRELRWAVKERMAYQPPQQQTKPRGVLVPNAFTVPTDKKRASLRWRVQTDLANGLVPDPHRF